MSSRKTFAAFLGVAAVAALMLPAAAGADRDIRITYSDEDGTVKTNTFDLLVVACDPSALSHVFDGRTPLEERVETALERYTLGTSLWDVVRKKGEGNKYTIRMSPDNLSAGDGHGEFVAVGRRAMICTMILPGMRCWYGTHVDETVR